MPVVSNISKEFPVHFIGIGGIGMSGIAFTFLNRGYSVSGSDLKCTSITHRLEEAGATFYEGHCESNVPDRATVVYSSAVTDDNPEMRRARFAGLPIVHRAEALAWLMRDKAAIAIAGTHGKTTTTSLIALILQHAGLDPSAIVGGVVDAFQGNVLCGEGPYFVAEADESDGSFVNFHPFYSIITNIEEEHIGFYHDLQEIEDTFGRFIENIVPDGKLVYNLDERNVGHLADTCDAGLISYSICQPADFFADDISLNGFGSTFSVFHEGKLLGTMRLSIPGIHNVSNCLAVIAVATDIGIPFETIKEAICSFLGVRRRFEVKGQVDDILVIDDYAHHPTEVMATLRSARHVANGGRLFGVFQPHRYSRTKHLHHRFSSAFTSVDRLILTDIYGANEPLIEGIDGTTILRSVLESGQNNVEYFPDLHDIPTFLSEILRPGDVVITMGAGNITTVADELVRKLRERNTQLVTVASNE
ncbi:MAG: UDP-N-acetylmuramate--L-alanine ligase [bacterium]|nr:UDP-N-acetylmuramate--L-alanine ligase [bacterium]